MLSLTFTHMSKAYCGVPALKDVSLTLMGGRVHALMGENGAGKSTLIKLIAGVVPADSMTVEKDGNAISLVNAQDAQAANFRFIHQELNIVPQISVAENILLGRRFPRRFGLAVDWPSVRERARAALRFLGADHIDVRQLAGDFTAGDQMLIKIAAALVTDPDTDARADLYVLDEPTAALDANMTTVVENLIKQQLAGDVCVLLVTHDPKQAERIADRSVRMMDGRLHAEIGVLS